MLVRFAPVILFFGMSSAHALDVDTYLQLTGATIRQMDMGVVGDIDEMIAVQEELMVLGIEGGVDYLVSSPENGQPLNLVILNAEKMKNLTIDDIERLWHGGEFLRSKGIDPEKIDHFGPMMSLMDAVIHPATAYILLKEYKKTGNPELLQRVKAELMEVAEHVKHVNPDVRLTESN